jgi:beta-glucanase (GH16 family)
MANLSFLLRATFGLLPNAQKIESSRNALQQEYNKLTEFKNSQDLKDYLELKELIDSEAFQTNKKAILSLDYKKAEEYQKEQQFNKNSKQKQIINYFRVLNSPEFQTFIAFEKSEVLAEYQELKSYISSDEHKNLVTELEQKHTDEINKQKTYKQLKSSPKIKAYYKTLNSSQLKNYQELTNSSELLEFEELKKFATSKQLQEFKDALVSQLASENDKKNQCKQLKNNPDIVAYNKLKNNEGIEKPKALIEYVELDQYIQSTEYQQLLNSLQYKNTDQYKKETRFKTLEKNKKFIAYYKFQSSAEFSIFQEFNDSLELKTFEELQQEVTSPKYSQVLEELKYPNSDEYKKEVALNQLKNNESIKAWEKFRNSKAYLLFQQTKESALLEEYNSLKELVESSKFQEYRTYMLDKEKWKKTEEFAKETRYQQLKKSPDIIWYQSVAESAKFDSMNAWKVTFEDDFTSGRIDEKKWMNSFFWGKVLLNDRYVMAGDKHYYTDNKNIELNGTVLKIVTRQEQARGKVWHPLHGFSEKDFNYTSGMLSTAHSFRQLYGKFEAKIKLAPHFPVYQAFWLKGEKILPEIDVFKFNMDKKNRYQMSALQGDASNSILEKKATSKINGGSLTNDFYIYTIEWTPEKITWKINDFEVFTTSEGIPNEPLYIMLSAGIQKDIALQQPSAMFEIDWIRCYEKV